MSGGQSISITGNHIDLLNVEARACSEGLLLGAPILSISASTKFHIYRASRKACPRTSACTSSGVLPINVLRDWGRVVQLNHKARFMPIPVMVVMASFISYSLFSSLELSLTVSLHSGHLGYQHLNSIKVAISRTFRRCPNPLIRHCSFFG